MAIKTFVAQFTIPSGAAVSNAVAINGTSPVTILMPAGWDAASVQFEASLDNVTWYACRTLTGALIQADLAAGQSAQVNTDRLHGWDWMRLRSVTIDTLTDVNQTANRVLTVVTMDH